MRPLHSIENGSGKQQKAAHLVGLSPPLFAEDGAATVNVLLDLTEREGEASVVRRFLVETEMVREGPEWYLTGVSTTCQRGPQIA